MKNICSVVFVVIIAVINSWVPAPIDAQHATQRPIAIDGIGNGEQFVLGDGGTVFRIRHERTNINVAVFAHLPSGESPVDLTLVNVSKVKVLGVDGAVLVLTTQHLPQGASCHVNAFDLPSGGSLGGTFVSGTCGGIDVFPGVDGIYAYVTTSGENRLNKIELLPGGFGKTTTVTTLESITRPGAIAVSPGGTGWFIADAAGAGVSELTTARTGYKIVKVAGVNTSVSSLRMASNGILYATDTSMQRVFRLVRLHGILTPDIVPKKISFIHPTGITTAGRGFVVIDDGSGLVNILGDDWSLVASTKLE